MSTYESIEIHGVRFFIEDETGNGKIILLQEDGEFREIAVDELGQIISNAITAFSASDDTIIVGGTATHPTARVNVGLFDGAGAADSKVSDATYNKDTWANVINVAPSKNAVRNALETLISGGALSTLDLSTATPKDRQTLVWDAFRSKLVPGPVAVQDGPYIQPLQRWQIAVANAKNAPAKILWIGDSEIEFATIHLGAVQRISNLLNDSNRSLSKANRANYGTWCPGNYSWGIDGLSPVWTQTGGLTYLARRDTRGISGAAFQIGDTKSVSLPATQCDRIKFYWLAGNAGATLDLKIDGVTVQTVNSAAAGNYTADVSPEPAGHTITITSHGTSIFDFVQFYWGNASKGLQSWTAGHSGTTSATALTWTDLPGYMTSISPDLVVIGYGVNDFGSDTTGASYFNNMSTLIDRVRANCSASIAILLVGEVASHTPWTTMQSKARQLASTKNVALIDASYILPSMASGDPLGMSLGDSIHYSVKGGELISEVIVQTLMGGPIHQDPKVDANGVVPAAGALFQGSTLASSGTTPPTLKISDGGYGGMFLELFKDKNDAHPIVSLGSSPNFGLPGLLQFGLGGGLDLDATLARLASKTLNVVGSGPIMTAPLNFYADVNSPANTSENSLFAQNLPSGLLYTNGSGIQGSMFGVFGNNARTKRLRIVFGGNVIYDTTVLSFTGATTDAWDFEFNIVRETATVVRCMTRASIRGSSTTIPTPVYSRISGLSDLSSNVVELKLTTIVGTGAVAADVVLKAVKVALLP